MSAVAPRRVWITGAKGQLGTELVRAAPAGTDIVATDRATADIGDRAAVLAFAAQAKPTLIINAAAYSAVDKAESEPELALRVNRDGAAHLAEAAQQAGARLIHLSTDYVFDGRQSTPYTPQDATNPLNAYGASKLAGERAVAEIGDGRALIVRTAWLYSAHGTNFARTMLRLLRERGEVRVVADQVGTPTQCGGLARALWNFAAQPDARGIHHWTDAGVASWYDFAQCIRVAAMRLQPGAYGRLVPIPAREYPTPARRPAYGVLDKSSAWAAVGTAAHWTENVPAVVETLLRGG